MFLISTVRRGYDKSWREMRKNGENINVRKVSFASVWRFLEWTDQDRCETKQGGTSSHNDRFSI